MVAVQCVFQRMLKWMPFISGPSKDVSGFNGLSKGAPNDKNLTMYIVRVRKDSYGNITLQDSAPCCACVRSLRICGIRKVIYSDGQSTIENPQIKVIKVDSLTEDYTTNGGKYYTRNNNINIYKKKDFQRILVSIPN